MHCQAIGDAPPINRRFLGGPVGAAVMSPYRLGGRNDLALRASSHITFETDPGQSSLFWWLRSPKVSAFRIRFGFGTEPDHPSPRVPFRDHCRRACLRAKVDPLWEDRCRAPDLEAACELVANGSVVAPLNAICGPLLAFGVHSDLCGGHRIHNDVPFRNQRNFPRLNHCDFQNLPGEPNGRRGG